jgi:hypothetical protein
MKKEEKYMMRSVVVRRIAQIRIQPGLLQQKQMLVAAVRVIRIIFLALH